MLYSLRLFVVDGEHIAMAMVVVGHICTQNVMGVHNTSYRLNCLMCVAMATCNLVGKMLLTSIIIYTFIACIV